MLSTHSLIFGINLFNFYHKKKNFFLNVEKCGGSYFVGAVGTCLVCLNGKSGAGRYHLPFDSLIAQDLEKVYLNFFFHFL